MAAELDAKCQRDFMVVLNREVGNKHFEGEIIFVDSNCLRQIFFIPGFLTLYSV